MRVTSFSLLLAFVCNASAKGVCIVRTVNGKWQKYGDCDDKKQSRVLKDLDDKVEKFNIANITSCDDIKRAYANMNKITSGVFNIYPPALGRKLEVYCDMETDGGRWTVFQRRMDGSEDFYRDWNDYVNGFGRKDKEFWLDRSLSIQARITTRFASTPLRTLALLAILSVIIMQFSTKDVDNDANKNQSCAQGGEGAWWYYGCYSSNLNGKYHNFKGYRQNGFTWFQWYKNYDNLKFSEMKFREQN